MKAIQLPLFTSGERLSRDERKDQIFAVLQGVPFALSARQIFDAIGLAKSPHALSILHEMVDDGMVKVESEKTTNGLTVFVYWLSKEYLPDA